MSRVAKTEPGTELVYGGHVFRFGKDGSRKVSEAEEAMLVKYADNCGGKPPVKISVSDEEAPKGESNKGSGE